jgi:hypothetical protein
MFAQKIELFFATANTVYNEGHEIKFWWLNSQKIKDYLENSVHKVCLYCQNFRTKKSHTI